MREKVVLAYSGGLDTSIIIPWLKENYDYDVIAFVADVGQGDDLDAVVDKAYKTGACKVVVEDLRQDLRAVLKKCRPDWDISKPELKAAWERGERDRFYPYGKTYGQVFREQEE